MSSPLAEIKRLRKQVRELKKDVAEYKSLYEDERTKRWTVESKIESFGGALKNLVPGLFEERS